MFVVFLILFYFILKSVFVLLITRSLFFPQFSPVGLFLGHLLRVLFYLLSTDGPPSEWSWAESAPPSSSETWPKSHPRRSGVYSPRVGVGDRSSCFARLAVRVYVRKATPLTKSVTRSLWFGLPFTHFLPHLYYSWYLPKYATINQPLSKVHDDIISDLSW